MTSKAQTQYLGINFQTCVTTETGIESKFMDVEEHKVVTLVHAGEKTRTTLSMYSKDFVKLADS